MKNVCHSRATLLLPHLPHQCFPKSPPCILYTSKASFGANTGFAINPARDFGPRLWIALVSGGASLTSYTWIPIVAPLLGGIAGALIYDFTIGKVIEAKRLSEAGEAVVKGRSVREPAIE